MSGAKKELDFDGWMAGLTEDQIDVVQEFIKHVDDDMLLEIIMRRTDWMVAFAKKDVEKDERANVDGMVLGTHQFINQTVKDPAEFVLLGLGIDDTLYNVPGELN